MKVVLIEATSDYYRRSPLSLMARVLEPLAIEYIGGYLQQYGHDIELIHQLSQDNDALSQQVIAANPHLVGISCMTYSFADAQGLARTIKRERPHVTIVLGGYHAIGLAECPDGFDFVVAGEGELPCRDILDLLDGRRLDAAGIPGVTCYRDPATGQSRPARGTSLTRQLTDLPWPIRLDRDLYFSMSMGENLPDTRLACVVVGRGCPYRCDFCCTPMIFHGRHTCRHIPDVVDEIVFLQAQYGINTVNVRDETFAPRSMVRAFCEELVRRSVRIQWRAFATVGTLDRETVQIMAEAGCHMLFYGIEASDAKTLRLRHKSFASRFDQIAIDISTAQAAGIFVRGGFIVGHENDTELAFDRHLSYLKQVCPDELYVSFLTPFPGTALYRRLMARGKVLTQDQRQYDCEHPIVDIGIPADILIRLRQDLYAGFYGSRQWGDHLKARMSSRPDEQVTIRRFVRFVQEHMGLPTPFSSWNGS